MAAGEIRRRGAPGNREVVRPRLQLPLVMRGAEPIFEYLMDSAANAENNTAAMLDEQRRTNELLARILQALKDVSILMDPTPGDPVSP